MIESQMEMLISQRKSLDPDDDRGTTAVWTKEIALLNMDLRETVNYLDHCSQEEFFWTSEVFEDISQHFQSKALVECMKRNQKRFPSISDDVDSSIYYAEQAVSE